MEPSMRSDMMASSTMQRSMVNPSTMPPDHAAARYAGLWSARRWNVALQEEHRAQISSAANYKRTCYQKNTAQKFPAVLVPNHGLQHNDTARTFPAVQVSNNSLPKKDNPVQTAPAVQVSNDRLQTPAAHKIPAARAPHTEVQK